MYSVDILHSLIRTMSKSEKRYFRMQSQLQHGKKAYLTLFDELDQCTVFQDNERAQLQRKFSIDTLEPARKHLYRVIMKSLRQFETDKDTEVRLFNLLHDSRILYNKGLVELSIEQLRRVMALALEHEKFLHYVQAARLELQYLARNRFAGILEFELIEKQKKIAQLLEHESKVSNHAMLYEVLVLRYWRNGLARNQSDISQLNDLLLQEYYLLNDPGYKSFESTRVHLQFQSVYLQMTGNPAGSLDVFKELNELFEKNEFLWKDTPLYYVQLLDGVLHDLRSMERFSDMPFFLEKLENIGGITGGAQFLVRSRALEHRLNALTDQQHNKDAALLLRDNAAQLKKDLPLLPVQISAELMFACARVHLVSREYSAALRLVNEVLNKPAGTISQSLHTLFELINLQINVASRNADYLFYAVRALQRKLRSEQKLYGVETFVIWFVKSWLGYKPLDSWRARIEALHDPLERQLVKELCLSHWCELIVSRKF